MEGWLGKGEIREEEDGTVFGGMRMIERREKRKYGGEKWEVECSQEINGSVFGWRQNQKGLFPRGNDQEGILSLFGEEDKKKTWQSTSSNVSFSFFLFRFFFLCNKVPLF